MPVLSDLPQQLTLYGQGYSGSESKAPSMHLFVATLGYSRRKPFLPLSRVSARTLIEPVRIAPFNRPFSMVDGVLRKDDSGADAVRHGPPRPGRSSAAFQPMGDVIRFPTGEPLSASESLESHPQESERDAQESASPSESGHGDSNRRRVVGGDERRAGLRRHQEESVIILPGVELHILASGKCSQVPISTPEQELQLARLNAALLARSESLSRES